MALELKEVLTSFGIDGEPEKITIDDFRKSITEKYVLREDVLKDEEIKTKITGNVFGKLNTKAAQLFDLKSGEVKDKKLEDILELAKNNYTIKLKELEEKAGEGNDKKVQDLMKKLSEKEAELSLKENGLKEWEKKYSEATSDLEGKMKSYKLNDKLGKVKASLMDKFTEDYKKNELVRTGFESHISNTYIFDLDDKDEPVVKLKADGSVVKSKVKIGHSATPEEIFMQEMEAKGVLKKNNTTERKQITTFASDNGEGKSKLHPKFQQRVAELGTK